MKGIKFAAFPMWFKEKVYDEEGNVVRNNDGEPIYVRVRRMVRHNAAYFPRKNKGTAALLESASSHI